MFAHATRPLVALAAALLLTVASWGILPVDTSYACSCMAPPPPVEARDASQAVFSGTVTALSPIPGNPGGRVQVGLHVIERWKGPEATDLLVLTSDSSASCGYGFEVGQSYLVYALVDEGRLTTSLCSRTAQLDQAGADLAALGPGAPAPAAPAESGGATTWLVASAAAALLVAGGIVIALRRRQG